MRKTKNSSQGRDSISEGSPADDVEVRQLSTDSDLGDQEPVRPGDEEGSATQQQREAGSGQDTVDSEADSNRSDGGSAGPKGGDESSSSREVKSGRDLTEALDGDAPGVQRMQTSGRMNTGMPSKHTSVATSARASGGKSMAGAKIGMAALMASNSKGKGASHPPSSSAVPPARTPQFRQVAMTPAQLAEYNAWLQQRVTTQEITTKKGAAVTFSSVPAATFNSNVSPSTPHSGQGGSDLILVEDSGEEEEERHETRQILTKGDEKKGGAAVSPRHPAYRVAAGNRSNRKDEEDREGSRKKQEHISPKKALTSPKKRPVAVTKLPRCPRCGSTEEHDWVSCRAMMADFPRSTAENLFLRSLSQLQHMAVAAKRSQFKEALEESADEGEDLEEPDSSEEEELEEEDLDVEVESEDEECSSEDEEEDEEESYIPSSASRSRSSTSSDPTYQPSTSLDSREAPSVKSRKLSYKPTDRMARMEQALEQLTSVISSLVRREVAPVEVAVRHRGDHHESGRDDSRPRSPRKGTVELHRSVLRDPTGMEGCPEMQRDDLLQLSKFEDFEKKYKEYVDKASDRRRTYHRMVHGFRKFSFELRQYIKSLLNKSRTLREAYQTALPSFDLTEDQFLLLNNVTFGKLYREVCTHHSCLPSQVLQKLEKTSFPRGRAGDDSTLPALVVRASAAFREKLKEQPRQTIRQCTDKQLKESFIRMLLGPEERNLADFPSANTWEQVLSELLELDGTSQADTLLRKIQLNASRTDTANNEAPDPKTKLSSQAMAGVVAVRPKHRQSGPSEDRDDSAWQQQFEKLSAEFHPTASDLQDCNTFQQKVKRILTIRDTRKRENEMKAMRAALPPSVGTTFSTTASTSVSKSQLADDVPTCFYCKEKGHYKRDCPKRKPAHSDGGEE